MLSPKDLLPETQGSRASTFTHLVMLFSSVTDIDCKTYREMSMEVYNDWGGIGEITSLPDHAPHRKNDMRSISGDDPEVITAIVCPPTKYGLVRGPGSTRSYQIPELRGPYLRRSKVSKLELGVSWPQRLYS